MAQSIITYCQVWPPGFNHGDIGKTRTRSPEFPLVLASVPALVCMQCSLSLSLPPFLSCAHKHIHAVKSTDCSYTGSRFNSKEPHSNSQLPVLRDQKLSGLTSHHPSGTETYMQAKHPQTWISNNNE